MFDGPFLWYLNRATGVVLLALLTLTVVMGLRASVGRAGRLIPRFVTQHLHRNVGLLSVALLVVHVISAVVDTYVTINWWEAFVPFSGTYKTLWLSLGTLALDLMLAIVATSLLRTRLGERSWKIVHLLSYLAWGIAVVHGVGIGTDSRSVWGLALYFGSVGVVWLAWLTRYLGWAIAERAR